jgi:hypothetical protein
MFRFSEPPINRCLMKLHVANFLWHGFASRGRVAFEAEPVFGVKNHESTLGFAG